MKIGIKLRKVDKTWNTYVEKLSSVADTELIYEQSLMSKHEGIEILITTSLCSSDVEKLPDLKAVFLFKTGMDELPRDVLNKKNVKIFPSHANADIIAEHALALALSLLHRINEFDADLRRNVWFADGKNYCWKSISSLKIGILGYGCIGSSLVKKLSGMTSLIMALNKNGMYGQYVIAASNLYELLEWSDLLFICLPKTSDTVGMIDSDALRKMKGKYIVNIARAEICDEEALYNSLRDGELAGYASDVWYLEPDKMDRTKPIPPSKFSFANMKNVVLSPHCATHEFGAHERYIADTVERCMRYMREESL